MEYSQILQGNPGNTGILVRWQDGQSHDTAPEVVAMFPKEELDTLALVVKLLNYNETPPEPIPE